MSSRAEVCPHCGFSKSGATVSDHNRKARHKQFLKIQSINNQAALSVLLFVLGFAYMYWGGANPSQTEYYVALGISALGFILYIVNRVRMVIAKRSK